MTKEELEKRNAEIEKAKEELAAQIRSGEISTEQAEERMSELKNERQQLKQAEARMNSPDFTDRAENLDFTELRKNLLEKRAITLTAELGGQVVVNKIVEEMKAKTPLLGIVSTFHGLAANTMIPVFYPGLAKPAGQNEGASGIAKDKQAKLGAESVKPFPFVSVLPISYDALKFNTVELEAKLPSLFAHSFSSCFHEQIISGTGVKQFKGLSKMTFEASKTTEAASAGKLAVTDLAAVALEVADKTDRGCVIMHPSVYAKILADSPEKDLSAVYLKTLIEDKSIEGVKIVLTSYMPKEVTAGKIVAIAGELDKYGMAIAGQLDITPKVEVGDINVYFEAVMYANGLPILNDFYALKAK